jgi:hypothetical protein
MTSLGNFVYSEKDADEYRERTEFFLKLREKYKSPGAAADYLRSKSLYEAMCRQLFERRT